MTPLADPYDSKERAILHPEWLSSGCVVLGTLAPQQAGRSASEPPRCLEDSVNPPKAPMVEWLAAHCRGIAFCRFFALKPSENSRRRPFLKARLKGCLEVSVIRDVVLNAVIPLPR